MNLLWMKWISFKTICLSQAGEDTDVILGLGYDNTLGNKLGITLIATGFEHKDPFTKRERPKAEAQQEDKIVMTLGGELLKEKCQGNQKCKREIHLAPTLVDEIPMPQMQDAETDIFLHQYLLRRTSKKKKPQEVHLQLKLKEEPTPMEIERRELEAQKQALEDKFAQLRQNILGNVNTQQHSSNNYPTSAASGGYLARPSNIYADSKPEVSLQNLPKNRFLHLK
jgi:cell division protein FtsZ